MKHYLFLVLTLFLTTAVSADTILAPAYGERLTVDRQSDGSIIPKSSLAVGAVWTQTTVSVDSTGAQVLAANDARRFLLIVNKGSSTVFLKVDGLPGAGEGIPIPAGGNYENSFAPQNAIYLKASTGTQSVELIEGSAE